MLQLSASTLQVASRAPVCPATLEMATTAAVNHFCRACCLTAMVIERPGFLGINNPAGFKAM